SYVSFPPLVEPFHGLTAHLLASMLRANFASVICGRAFSCQFITEHASRWLSPRVAGVILAGGRNSRMGGTDKAFLRVHGQTIFERTVHVLRDVCEEIIVVTNRPEKYAGFDIEIATDEFPLKGPLAGMHAAL